VVEAVVLVARERVELELVLLVVLDKMVAQGVLVLLVQ
jgi:hypothetical protein